jgi:hypothetical protein
VLASALAGEIMKLASVRWVVIVCFVLSFPVRGSAEDLIASYTARLSSQDHFNSRGVRLRNVAAIIRQDRANFHRFGVRDAEDEGDGFFEKKSNRAKMERMLNSGGTTVAVRSKIINGTPLVRIDIYGLGNSGTYIRVEDLAHNKAAKTSSEFAGNVESNRTENSPSTREKPGSIGFRTPSNNIHCLLDDYGVKQNQYPPFLRCDIYKLSTRPPRRPPTCDGDWGQAYSISARGQRGQRMCVTDAVINPRWPVLQYGRNWRGQGFICKSRRTGLTCTNSYGHGFFLSRRRQDLF